MKRTIFICFCFVLLFGLAYAETMEAENPGTKDEGFSKRLLLSPKISYVGSFALGIEISPLIKLFDSLELMTEANWVFWNWNGAKGFGYGEINLVYDQKIIEAPQVPLNLFFGGGLIYGSVIGDASYQQIVGKFSGGTGYSVFIGITGKTDPYIWFAQFKYASAPVTLSVIIPSTIITPSYQIDIPREALGSGIEFGIRFPL